MKVGDRVKVNGNVPEDAGRVGYIRERDSFYKDAWCVEFDDEKGPTPTYFESELDLVEQECTPHLDLTGKHVWVLRGAWKDLRGVVVDKNEWGEWNVLLQGRKSTLSFSEDRLQVFDEPVGAQRQFAYTNGTSSAPKVEPRKFTADELRDAAQGDSLPTQWDEVVPDALDTFLSLIGNCGEVV